MKTPENELALQCALQCFEHILTNATMGAGKVIWDVLPGGTRGDTRVGLTVFGVVDIATNCTDILHDKSPY
jgi:hypothetical protein